MALPTFQDIMLPLLESVRDGKEHFIHDIQNSLEKHFNLKSNEIEQKLPSGKQCVFSNRVGWASTYLKKALLIESVKRGYIIITDRGREILKEKPKRIDMNYLERFSEYRDFKKQRKERVGDEQVKVGEKTPEELLEYSYQNLIQNLSDELLERIMKCPPKFFEELVIDLLLAMGYGGSRKDAGKSIGRSGDGGIDGFIMQDKLGLDILYVQAKRWESTVAIEKLRAFSGTLTRMKARKGVFITTSSFPKDAYDFVREVEHEHKIILVDGEKLTNLMIDHNVGVSVQRSFVIKKIDSDYFSEE